MILPWLAGFRGFLDVPLTWTLVAINLVFFFVTNQGPGDIANLNKKEIQWAGRFYSQMRNEEVPRDGAGQLLKGSQALRDQKFWDQLPLFQAPGDAVGFEIWKKHLVEFQQELISRPVDMFGLHTNLSRPLTWITYQFMHSGIWHVFGNLLMLLIFGAALEKLMGSSMLTFVYLFGGLCGAAFFVMLSPPTTAPMVGASASVSAVMAFYALAEKRKRVRYFYFLSPSNGYWGEIYLPTLLIIPFYFVEDLGSYLSTAEEIGTGIAYTAHIGGAAFGFALALMIRQVCSRFPEWERILYASYSQSHNVAP